MKIIKNMRQLIPGMKVNVYSPKGTKIEHELIVESVYAYTVKLYGMEFAITFGGNTFELVSYPERRKLTWEYAKSKVDEWPIKVYCGEWSYNLECANPKFAYLGYECGCHYWTDEERVFFIDPPHPEVEDVTPPWEVEGKKSTPLECPNYEENENITEPDDKVKRLWWYAVQGSMGLAQYPYTELEFVTKVIPLMGFDRYAPGPIVPDVSEWKEVK